MPSLVLTDRALNGLKPKPGQQFELFDRSTPGLSLRVSPGGAKCFSLCYRIAGCNRRLTIGRYPLVTLAEARKRARDALTQVARGLDPANEKIRVREQYASRLVPAVLDDFIEHHAKRKTRNWKETERILRSEFAAPWRKLPITLITRQAINSLVDDIVRRGTPSAANHAFAEIRKVLNWAVGQGYLSHSPCLGMKAPSKVVTRDRVLSDVEVTAVWLAAEKMGWPFGRVVHLLLLTAQRRDEVSGLRWADLNSEQRLWTQPAMRNKAGRLHVVPLSPLAFETIRSLPRVHAELIFPARGKDRPLSGFSKWKRTLDDLSGVTGWTLHDLRRTAATGMAGLAVPPHIVELILNHQGGVLGGIAGIYNRFQYLDDRRLALDRWCQHVEELIQRPVADCSTSFLPTAARPSSTAALPERAAVTGLPEASRKEQRRKATRT